MIKIPITIRQGETWQEAFTLRNPATGDLIDCTGYTGTMTIWDNLGNVLATASLVVQSMGIVSYTLLPATTSTLPGYPTFTEYEIMYTRPDATVDYFQEGTAYIEKRP